MIDEDELTISLATYKEADAVLKLCYLSYQSEAELYKDWSIAPLRESYADVLAALKDETVVVLKIGEEVIGSIRGRQVGDKVEIGRLVVHPRFQRRGFAVRLMNAIEGMFPSKTFVLFTGHLSAVNLRLYRKLGYVDDRVEIVSGDLQLIFLTKLFSP